MKFTQNNFKTLNISAKEAKILKTLAPLNSAQITNLANETKIPRTSVEFYLKKLNKRGLVEKIKIKNHNEWRKTDDQKLLSQFRDIINNLDFYSEVVGKIEDKSIVIEIFRSNKKIIEAVSKLLKLNPAYRIYYIQCANSPKYQLTKIPKEFVFEFHKKLKKSGIIMDVIAAESILPFFNKLSVKELKSHLDRKMVNYLITDEYIDFDADIIMHNDLIIILNYHDESVIFIKNKLISNIFSSLFEFMQNFAKKIDLNKHIKMLIEEKY